MTPDGFRRLALSLEGAVESEHMRHPDFRVGGKIFATLGYPDHRWGTVMLSPEHQREFVSAAPSVFRPAAGAWGRSGSTNVNLRAATKDVLLPALHSAMLKALLKGLKPSARGKSVRLPPRAANSTTQRRSPK